MYRIRYTSFMGIEVVYTWQGREYVAASVDAALHCLWGLETGYLGLRDVNPA